MKNQNKRERILDAAQELMETSSIRSVSVQKIAQNAGIGKGSIYYYFSSKNEIIEAVIERSYFRVLDEAQTLVASQAIGVFEKMKIIEDAISEYYYYEDKVDAQGMQEGIYKGMVNSLDDPYSEYYSKEELEEVINSNQGISYGIGAYISMSKQMNMAMINGVMEESPAQEAGLREGDIIYEVDGESTQGMSLTQVVSLV